MLYMHLLLVHLNIRNKMKTTNINGSIDKTTSGICVKSVSLILSHDDAYALCNVISKDGIELTKQYTETAQRDALIRIGRALAKVVDHPSKDKKNE